MADTNTVRKADAPTPKLTPETFKQLGDLIYEMTGIHFQDNKTYLLESRLLPRLKACRCQTFESYLNYLRFDAYRDREVTELYTVITTNETYFFRDEAQLESFMKVMIPEVMKTNAATKQIRIWSAACSTGDEPYTLALLLRDYPPLSGWTIDILATDISENVLQHRQDSHIQLTFTAQSSTGHDRQVFHREEEAANPRAAGEGHGAIHERESVRPSETQTGARYGHRVLP